MIKRLASLPQFKIIVSTAVCSLAFLYFLFGLELNIPLSVILVGLLYLGIHLLLVTYDPQVSLYEQTIKEANRKLNGIRHSVLYITDIRIKTQVTEIINITEQVLKYIQKKNTSMPLVRRMLTFYLDNTLEIVEKYASLQNQKYIDPSTMAIIKKIEDLITSIRINFESQLNKLLKNDLSEISIKMDVLKEILQMEEGQ
ncbi:hypothetical protein GK047_24680 [Paenibacillus sp. SYP-B3998]|uniref:5-bromo-4-chloroindolyl phosphate hydrolase n=1 Tax=Paenibacillus sp. SYP-B3998 TaxID=2678564 RepID=A0A6G4A5F3_9BACL|nr:5-bromo-4-chloroindolyl phosphate hydrolysis family protein [Paenibacillus sp. SYP-B3998]NEW09174.1 hypothetical protein [Paenibacillus sp. SYP-B3998]